MAGFWKKALKFGAKPLQGIQRGVQQGVSHLPGMNDQRAQALTDALGGGIGENGLPGQPKLPGMPGGAKVPGLPNLPALPGMAKPDVMPPQPGVPAVPDGMQGQMTPMPMPGMEGAPIGEGGPVPGSNKLAVQKPVPGDYSGTAMGSVKGLAGGIPMRGGGRMV